MRLALSLLLIAAPGHGPYYGITAHGGVYGFGSVIMDDGKSTETIFSFCPLGEGQCWDGGRPNSLVMLPDGSLVGTTSSGGENRSGVLFQLQPTDTGWRERTVASFCWYWHDCGRFGTPKGTLTYIGLHRGLPLLEGVIQNKKGRGLIYRATLGPDGDGIWLVRYLKHGQ